VYNLVKNCGFFSNGICKSAPCSKTGDKFCCINCSKLSADCSCATLSRRIKELDNNG